jgi:hypothetical protein
MDAVIGNVTEQKTSFAYYEASLDKTRKEFAQYVAPYLGESNPRTLMLFWIYYSANGVGMTEPVEEWLTAASESCHRQGYKKLASQLAKHVIHESGHHVMMLHDLDKLVSAWNSQYTPKLDAKALLNSPTTEAVIAFRDLHLRYINSDCPYGQIAIEYEIEGLALSFGSLILNQSVEVLGKEILTSLSFIDDHVRIDVAHTEFNRKELVNFIEEYPHTVDHLIQAGAEALNTYGVFFRNCHRQAVVLSAS